MASFSKETCSFAVCVGGVEGSAPSQGGRSGSRTGQWTWRARLLGHRGSRRGDISLSLVKSFELHFLIPLSS